MKMNFAKALANRQDFGKRKSLRKIFNKKKNRQSNTPVRQPKEKQYSKRPGISSLSGTKFDKAPGGVLASSRIKKMIAERKSMSNQRPLPLIKPSTTMFDKAAQVKKPNVPINEMVQRKPISKPSPQKKIVKGSFRNRLMRGARRRFGRRSNRY